MSKPLGVGLVFAPNATGIALRVTPVDRTVDHVWDAVEEAILAGMTPKEFAREAEEAWQSVTQKHADWAKDDAAKAFRASQSGKDVR